jgi:hypothetical protein
MNNPTPPKPQNFMFLWYIIALIYVINAVYMGYFVSEPDMAEAAMNIALAIMFVSIGYTFTYTPPGK